MKIARMCSKIAVVLIFTEIASADYSCYARAQSDGRIFTGYWVDIPGARKLALDTCISSGGSQCEIAYDLPCQMDLPSFEQQTSSK